MAENQRHSEDRQHTSASRMNPSSLARQLCLMRPLTFTSLGKNNLPERFTRLSYRMYPLPLWHERVGGTTRQGVFARRGSA